MKLSRNDLRIIMLLKKEGRAMANYQIAHQLMVHPAQTHKRLAIMEREKILHSDKSYPRFYSFNGRNMVQNFIILTVECPKCQAIHIIHHTQCTIQCDCTTKSGRKTRFYVFDKRIKSMNSIFKNPNQEKITLTNKLNPFES